MGAESADTEGHANSLGREGHGVRWHKGMRTPLEEKGAQERQEAKKKERGKKKERQRAKKKDRQKEEEGEAKRLGPRLKPKPNYHFATAELQRCSKKASTVSPELRPSDHRQHHHLHHRRSTFVLVSQYADQSTYPSQDRTQATETTTDLVDLISGRILAPPPSSPYPKVIVGLVAATQIDPILYVCDLVSGTRRLL
ncbi:hypothetical protein ACLB2K_006869 [Fragaria x ananassa]